jgi:hypothetical protein
MVRPLGLRNGCFSSGTRSFVVPRNGDRRTIGHTPTSVLQAATAVRRDVQAQARAIENVAGWT